MTPEPIDIMPGQATILGGPEDGMVVERFAGMGSHLAMVDVEKMNERKWWELGITNLALSSEFKPSLSIIQLPYRQYTWYEYFWFEWFFVPIGWFIQTFAIHPSLEEAE